MFGAVSLKTKDTSKLWVKTNTIPSSVDIKGDLSTTPNDLSLFLGLSTLGSYKYNLSSIVVGNYLYIFGGYNNSSSYSGYIYKVDLQTKTITYTTSMSVERIDVALANVGNYIYIFGGRKDISTSYQTIERYDITTDTLTTMTATLPSANFGMGTAVIGTDIYIVYGRNSYNILKYDTVNDTISTEYTDDRNLTGFGITVYGNYIYTFGGYNYVSSSNRTYTIYIFKYDTVNKTRTATTSVLPSACGYGIYGKKGNDFYIIGGITDTSGTKLNTIVKFNLLTETIETSSSTISFSTNTETTSSSSLDNEGNIIAIALDGSSQPTIYTFDFDMTLTEDNLLIIEGGQKVFNIINSNNLQVKCYPSAVYLGDSNNKAQKVECALYNTSTTSWENI